MVEPLNRFTAETFPPQLHNHLTETIIGRLETYVRLLQSWQKAKNLVAPDTLRDVWSRHIVDSFQLVPILSAWAEGQKITLQGMDLGSGAGLPGAILAIGGADHLPKLAITLVEANNRKASFLRTVSRETGAPFSVLPKRIEELDPSVLNPSFITARALAPLSKLVAFSDPWLHKGATAFFHKGGEYAEELRDWPAAAGYDVVEHLSVVDPRSRILQISRRA